MRAGRVQGGFTLLELIVVITIMAMVAGLVLVAKPWQSVGLDSEATVRALTNGLRLARSRAIAQDRDVTVVTGARGFSVDGGPPWVLPAQEVMSAATIVFIPDGGSTGGVILLRAGDRQITIDVNWLTGHVQARELAAR